MRFLLEQDLLPDNLIRILNLGSTAAKLKALNQWFKQPENANLRTAQDKLTDIFLNINNFDSDDFISYLEHLDKNIKLYDDEAGLIYNLIKNNKLDYREDWLYNKSLYDDSKENNLYKIKLLTIASDPRFQAGFNKQIKPEDFFDGNKLKDIEDIKAQISNIKQDASIVNKTITLLEALNRALALQNKEPLKTSDDIINYLLALIRTDDKWGILDSQSIETIISQDAQSKKDLIELLNKTLATPYKGSTWDIDLKLINSALLKASDSFERQLGIGKFAGR